ncbi:hypothetical protein [Nocardioides sp. GY 10127]|uniref:hypothetical protein n=1 Tax=Nocardioides sp. GY 10127 TaxID=2569762 RepID=UPI0010A77878|nr:hypothetical protein [Nocardioides sp. GY 10127]TIC83329.1 hypothetical protein E8D37_07265 [Nocardioides sp. GY 10127]
MPDRERDKLSAPSLRGLLSRRRARDAGPDAAPGPAPAAPQTPVHPPVYPPHAVAPLTETQPVRRVHAVPGAAPAEAPLRRVRAVPGEQTAGAPVRRVREDHDEHDSHDGRGPETPSGAAETLAEPRDASWPVAEPTAVLPAATTPSAAHPSATALPDDVDLYDLEEPERPVPWQEALLGAASPYLLAPVAGLGAAAVMVVLVALAQRGCLQAAGTASCGQGPGATLLVLALMAGVLSGGALLRQVRSPQPGATALLGTGATAVIAVMLADRVPGVALAGVLLVVSAAFYLLAQLLTTAAEELD